MSFIYRTTLYVICAALLPLSQANAKDTTRILLFGDSIIAGYGVQASEALPVQLEKLLNKDGGNFTVVNGGVSGDTTTAGRSRLAWMLGKSKPDLVLVALGGNDVLRGIPPQVTKENITAMLEMLKQKNINTILSAVEATPSLGAEYKKEFDAIYPDVAKNYNVPLYPFLLTHTYNNKELMQPDGIHPNAKGAEAIAIELANFIKQNLPV